MKNFPISAMALVFLGVVGMVGAQMPPSANHGDRPFTQKPDPSQFGGSDKNLPHKKPKDINPKGNGSAADLHNGKGSQGKNNKGNGSATDNWNKKGGGKGTGKSKTSLVTNPNIRH